MNAAKKYWETHDFNPINIEHYDPDKEKEFADQRSEEQRTHGKDWVQKLPKSWKEEGGLYNPINGRIEDQKRLYERDLKEKNKRKRFELRYDMERAVHKRALGEEERSAKISLNKVSVQRFNDTTERGFDILTNKKFNVPADLGSKTIYNPYVKPPPSTWTKIKHSSNTIDDYASIVTNTGSGVQFATNEEIISEPKALEDLDSKDINDRLGDTIDDNFFKKEVERRSKRLNKGSKTLSNFHSKSSTLKDTQAAVKHRFMNNTPNIRETNISALRKVSNVAASQQIKDSGSVAQRTGRNIVSETPKSKAVSVVSSNRAIRTGAFQRINSVKVAQS